MGYEKQIIVPEKATFLKRGRIKFEENIRTISKAIDERLTGLKTALKAVDDFETNGFKVSGKEVNPTIAKKLKAVNDEIKKVA